MPASSSKVTARFLAPKQENPMLYLPVPSTLTIQPSVVTTANATTQHFTTNVAARLPCALEPDKTQARSPRAFDTANRLLSTESKVTTPSFNLASLSIFNTARRSRRKVHKDTPQPDSILPAIQPSESSGQTPPLASLDRSQTIAALPVPPETTPPLNAGPSSIAPVPDFSSNATSDPSPPDSELPRGSLEHAVMHNLYYPGMHVPNPPIKPPLVPELPKSTATSPIAAGSRLPPAGVTINPHPRKRRASGRPDEEFPAWFTNMMFATVFIEDSNPTRDSLKQLERLVAAFAQDLPSYRAAGPTTYRLDTLAVLRRLCEAGYQLIEIEDAYNTVSAASMELDDAIDDLRVAGCPIYEILNDVVYTAYPGPPPPASKDSESAA
ncbi:hypothetical protein BDN72DRAFT_864328 [Pluteus cervinus]|uniref:Uncharacterized protein n=1 Tax=Pluteus cervinus TaxID=181527 RepID=A0ACD3A423_9AGAR|nr:hypothetical protein BDN72DRAFT_864328 [Pluteus cervinus]